MNKKHCEGCRENFYNGNNELGVKECWRLKTAKLVTRWMVYWWSPPSTATKVRVPSCYCQTGHAAYYEKDPRPTTRAGV